MQPPRDVQLEQVRADDGDARQILRQYYREIVERYHRREITDREVDEAMSDEPSDDLVAPAGVLVVARSAGRVVGCGGIRLVGAHVGELTRVFVAPSERGTGLAPALVGHLEDVAREIGLTRLRLDTRADLVEARALYAKLGYDEVEPYNDDPYADHWFAKAL